ncbi:AidA/PixA family protein [Pseudomonas sp. NPDC087346]|uniref:AidA/PixA family protein n=1 Tax=Pseudomonas sp. NPDC087346 TaxID=3364438 RepID=UPI00381D87EF
MTSAPVPSPSSGDTSAHNILLIIDAESLLTHYPSPSQDAAKPTGISDGFIFFAAGNTSKEIVINDSKITLPVDIGQLIHLRGRTVSLITDHSAVIYGMTVDNSGILSNPALEVHTGLTVPAPNPQSPTEPSSHKADDHFWACTTKKPGTVKCELSFMLVNQQCEAVGYFHWTTEIVIKP